MTGLGFAASENSMHSAMKWIDRIAFGCTDAVLSGKRG
jgi:hypothetical protein